MLPTIVEKYSLVPGRGVVVFDPATLMVTSLASSAIGGGMSAMSTIAGGNAAAALGGAQQQEANYEANQVEANAGSDLGAAQRRMLDTQQKARFAASTAVARAGGNGVDTSVGSPVAIAKSIASRGSYQSLMDLWQGQNQYTNDLNRASALRYGGNIAYLGGQMTQSADYLRAGGTIAGAAGSMASSYGRYMYPQTYGGGGMGYG